MMKANALILLITALNLLRLGAVRSREGQPLERAAIHRATIDINDSAYIKVFRGSLVEDLNTFNYWPPNESSEFHRIINRLGNSISSQKPPTEVSSPPISSSASQEEEFTAINRKLEEVRQMINFLEAQKNMEYSIGADGCDLCPDGAATSLIEDAEIFSLLEELGEDLFVSDDLLLPSNSSIDACNESHFD